ncbi:NUDIX hydrolase [Teredinibacter sp. KSP-S5-2]|uniref:NUDIX hydrolase n=1 Tax=Teredinibacter sp. KSP-S5-2 TaxID=3034506 RepID=UPI0029349B3E|nr:NUDIX hydrolase [Teredinibacter sp. KSP-S5-2]WNO08365.1 NUDIX hydrolase [Teredinibacter sp. KSP-S5-2]
MTITFANRQNECVETQDGRRVWLSRACAVVAQVCLYRQSNQTWYVLLGKRGSGVPDFQGHWCFPCGYLDWDETLAKAMLREVWEECGVYLPHLATHDNFVHSDNPAFFEHSVEDEQPWHIADIPRSTKQNISFHYALFFSWDGDALPELSNQNCEPDEVDDLGWFSLQDASELTLAFNHNERLAHLLRAKSDNFSQPPLKK